MFGEQLQEFELPNVEFTGEKLSGGSGSYGYVEVVLVAGTRCAAKFTHTVFEEYDWEKSPVHYFREECSLMSRLRHPHIVQFLGICYRQEAVLPALVMELLMTCLHNFLESETAALHNCIKRSILLDVSRGLVYLHGMDIVHRDLSARNVLLTSSLTAKIADLGMARFFTLKSGKLAATMTKAPGNANYMPPEAQNGDVTRYGKPIDCFSIGNLILFTITQKFPQVLSSTYFNDTTGFLEARSEVERRQKSFKTAQELLCIEHPLTLLACDCLGVQPSARPTASQIMQRLEAFSTLPYPHWNQSKLELIRNLLGRKKTVHELRQELCRLTEVARTSLSQLSVQDDHKEAVEDHSPQREIATPQSPTSPSLDSTKPLYINISHGGYKYSDPSPPEENSLGSPSIQHSYNDISSASSSDDDVFVFVPPNVNTSIGCKRTTQAQSAPPAEETSRFYENVCPSPQSIRSNRDRLNSSPLSCHTKVVYDNVPPKLPPSFTDKDVVYDHVPPKFFSSSEEQSLDSVTPQMSQLKKEASSLNYDRTDEKAKIASKFYKKKPPRSAPKHILSELKFDGVPSLDESSPPRTRVGAMTKMDSPKPKRSGSHSISEFTFRDKKHLCRSQESTQTKTVKVGSSTESEPKTDLDKDDFRKNTVSISSAVFGSWTCRCTHVVHVAGAVCEECGNEMIVSTLTN